MMLGCYLSLTEDWAQRIAEADTCEARSELISELRQLTAFYEESLVQQRDIVVSMY